MITPDYIVSTARAWLGTPFVHQGRVRGVGVDCGGLLIGVARELGLEVDEPPAYSQSPDPDIFRDYLQRHAHYMGRVDPRPGDLLHFALAGEPRHVGIASDIGVIHAWAKPGRVVEHRMDAVWLRRLHGVYRLSEVL